MVCDVCLGFVVICASLLVSFNEHRHTHTHMLIGCMGAEDIDLSISSILLDIGTPAESREERREFDSENHCSKECVRLDG